MPGIFGFTRGSREELDAAKVLDAIVDITRSEAVHTDVAFVDRHVAATRLSTRIINRPSQPAVGSSVYVWLDGSFCNQEEIAIEPQGGLDGDDASLLLRLYEHDSAFSFLDRIDGFFTAVVYDAERSLVHLISDRYGIRHLYWTQTSTAIAWGSEVKAFLAIPSFEPRIDPQAVRDFFSIGYILEARTWFSNVSLLDPGTVLTWDLRNQKLSTQRYWWWDRIRPFSGPLDEAELAGELGRLWRAAVTRRSRKERSVGIFLSGGLDSRAILAAYPHRADKPKVVTFGQVGSLDVQIAAEAAHVRGTIHHVHELSETNWWPRRIDAVWKTDGLLNLVHMHGSGVPAELCPINLSGFLGDVVLGGSYLRGPEFLDRPITPELAASFMKVPVSALTDDLGLYEKVAKSDVYGICNRGRKFIAMGFRSTLHVREQLLPFFDNDLIEFIFSLPDYLRWESRLYIRMLLREFPEYFRAIPWQKTGLPIGATRWQIARKRLFDKMRRVAVDPVVRALGRKPPSRQYANYGEWMRQEPAVAEIHEILVNPRALYLDYLPRSQVMHELERHRARGDKANELGRYLTFEIWLQQVFGGRYRREES